MGAVLVLTLLALAFIGHKPNGKMIHTDPGMVVQRFPKVPNIDTHFQWHTPKTPLPDFYANGLAYWNSTSPIPGSLLWLSCDHPHMQKCQSRFPGVKACCCKDSWVYTKIQDVKEALKSAASGLASGAATGAISGAVTTGVGVAPAAGMGALTGATGGFVTNVAKQAFKKGKCASFDSLPTKVRTALA